MSHSRPLLKLMISLDALRDFLCGAGTRPDMLGLVCTEQPLLSQTAERKLPFHKTLTSAAP